MKTLYFETAGIYDTEKRFNGLYTCRVRTAFTNNDGKQIYLELTHGDQWTYRTTNKRTGAPLKKSVRELIFKGRAWVDYIHYITGNSEDCNQNRIKYDRETPFKWDLIDIKNWINKTCNCDFDNVYFLPPFSGYYVHAGNGKYNFGDVFKFDFNKTVKRFYAYKILFKDYFNEIYKKHIAENKRAIYLSVSAIEYGAHSIVEYDDEKIICRSHTYADLITDAERLHTIYLKDIDLNNALTWFNTADIVY